MLREYALDPEAICDKDVIRTVHNLFDYSNPRRISDFPSKWTDRLLQIANSKKSADPKYQTVYKEIEIRVHSLIKNKAIIKHTSRVYDAALNWPDNAKASNRTEPFQAMVSSATGFIDPHTVDSTHSQFVCQHDDTFARNTDAIVNHLKFCLRHASEIIFIDPFISFDESMRSDTDMTQRKITATRYKTTFEKFFDEIRKNPNYLITRVVLSISGSNLNWSDTKISSSAGTYFKFPQSRIKVQIKPNSSMHNRYVLTDIASFQLGDSLWYDTSFAARLDRISMMSSSAAARIKFEFS